MPWEHCGAELSDEAATCPACGQAKDTWTVEFQVTRTFRVTRRPTVRFELLARDGSPVPDATYRVTLPDGEVVEGRTDEFGFAKVVAAESGECRVDFPSRRDVRLVGARGARAGGVVIATGGAKRTFRAGGLSLRVHGGGAHGVETRDWDEDEGSPDAAGSPPDGERVAPGRIEARGSDPLADAAAADAYGERVLESVWEIQQDRDETDCGPTCATFLRFGGIRCEGPPRHLLRGWVEGRVDERDEARVRGEDVQRLASQIRAETRFIRADHNQGESIRDHQVGLGIREELEALQEWAPVFRGRIATFELDTTELNAPGESFATFAAAFERRLRSRLGLNAGQQRRRGVVVHYVVVARNGPLPSEQVERSGAIYGTYHWCVVTDVRSSGTPRFGRTDGSHWASGVVVELHNPGPGCGYETWDLHELALMHRASPGAASSILYEAQETAGRSAYVHEGDVVCELDAGLSTWGVTLTATADGELLDYDRHADARAEELARAEHTTVAVIERPQGVYHVVKTDCADLDDALFEDENADHETAPSSYGDAVEGEVGFAAQPGVASVWVYARRVTEGGAEEFRWLGWEPEGSRSTRG